MTTTVAEIAVELVLDANDYIKGIKDAKNATDEVVGSVEKTGDSVGKMADEFDKGSESLEDYLAKFDKARDVLKKGNKDIKLSSEEIQQALDFAEGKISLDDLGDSVKKTSKEMQAFADRGAKSFLGGLTGLTKGLIGVTIAFKVGQSIKNFISGSLDAARAAGVAADGIDEMGDAVKDLQTSLGTELIIAIDPAVGGLGKRVQGIADLFRTMREQQDLVDAGVIEEADLAWLGLLATQEQLDEAMQQVNQELAKNPELMAEWGRGVEETGTQFAETASEIVGWVEQMRNIKPIPIAEIIKLRELEEEAEAAAEAMTIAQAGITGFTRETILAQAASGQTAGTVTALAKAFGNFSGLAAAATGHLILWQAELAKTGDLDEYMRKVEHLIELYAFIPQEFNTVILAEIRGEEDVIGALKKIEEAKRRAGGKVTIDVDGGGGGGGGGEQTEEDPGGFRGELAHGGRFRVGGVGGADSQRVSFFASPNETVTVETPAQVAARGSTRNTNIGTQNFFGIDLQEFEEALEDERLLD